MERKISLFVSRKHAMTWIAAAVLMLSVVARIVLECINGIPCPNVWFHQVLPVAATALYICIALVWGKEMFYKAAIPVWMIAVYFAFCVTNFGFSKLVIMLFWACLLFYAIIYTDITAGRGSKLFWLFLLQLAPLGAVLYLHRESLLAKDWAAASVILPDVLLMLGLILMVLAIRMHPLGEYHPTWGDRADGRKIRTLAPMAQITAYFQVERNTCSNLFDESFEITHIDRYIRQKRREG